MAKTAPKNFNKLNKASKVIKKQKPSRKIKERTRFILIKGIPPTLCKKNKFSL